MMTLRKTPANQQKLAQLKTLLGKTFLEVLQRGFHGSAGIEVVIQDGTIQSVRRTIEEIRR